jgi:hypothetical protein
LREIFAADFRDRIVHHLVVRELEKQWEPRFIFDSYACRKNKGIHAAVNRLQQFMLKASCNRKKAAYFLQLDIRSFFMSIDKQILFTIFKNTNFSEDIIGLLHEIIFHDCTENYYFRGDKAMLESIPPHKSLFKVEKGKGLPIGNLTSQFFANVYLDVLDQFVKHILKCRFYIRYVDDFLLISSSPEELQEWNSRIEIFLRERLLLELKPGARIMQVSEGANFLGYIVRPDYMLARRRVVGNLKYKIAIFKENMVSYTGQYIGQGATIGSSLTTPEHQVIMMNPGMVVELRQTIASYLGHFKHAQTGGLVRSLFKKNDWIESIFIHADGTIQEKLAPKNEFRTLRSQIRFFRSQLDGFLLFVHMGKYIELYDKDAEIMRKIAWVKLKEGFRGMKTAFGFPMSLKSTYLRKALEKGYSVAILEEGKPGKWIRHRYVVTIFKACSL